MEKEASALWRRSKAPTASRRMLKRGPQWAQLVKAIAQRG